MMNGNFCYICIDTGVLVCCVNFVLTMLNVYVKLDYISKELVNLQSSSSDIAETKNIDKQLFKPIKETFSKYMKVDICSLSSYMVQ